MARAVTAILALGVATSGSPASAQGHADEPARSDPLYQEAQRQLQRQDHTAALATLEQYLDVARTQSQRPEHAFWAMDQVIHILLGVQRDPDAAIAFFRRMRDDPRLDDLDRDAIDEWISVCEEWKTARAQKSQLDAKRLLERATHYYDSGRKKQEIDMEEFARSDFETASGYLLQFAIHYDKRPEIVDVLFMLGSIRFHLHADAGHWSDDYYLKEVIRRFPHTARSEEAFAMLDEELSRSYKPKDVPRELADDLALYRDLAKRAPTKK